MERLTYDFLVEAATPVAHHAENLGNAAILMTRKQRLPDGGWLNLPVVSGDTMRHGLREAGMNAYLEAAGVRDLTVPAVRLLFAGGQIGGKSGGGVSITQYRDMVELCPPLALLGGCVNNRMVPGRMIVDEAILVCEETMPIMPAWVREWSETAGAVPSPMRAHVEEVMRVRMDPTSQPAKRMMMSKDALALVETREADSELASSGDDAVAIADSKGSIMPRTHERIAAGSLLYWQVRADVHSELDHDTFHVMLMRFLGDAWVGGKRGTGHGHLRPVTARKIQLQTVATIESVDVDAVAGRIGMLFQQHVSARSEQIDAFLRGVAA